MFGLSFTEILVIMIVALLVYGPEGLPEIAKKLGKFFYNLQSTAEQLKSEILFSETEQKHSNKQLETNTNSKSIENN